VTLNRYINTNEDNTGPWPAAAARCRRLADEEPLFKDPEAADTHFPEVTWRVPRNVRPEAVGRPPYPRAAPVPAANRRLAAGVTEDTLMRRSSETHR
jgi:hypothetical protein